MLNRRGFLTSLAAAFVPAAAPVAKPKPNFVQEFCDTWCLTDREVDALHLRMARMMGETVLDPCEFYHAR